MYACFSRHSHVKFFSRVLEDPKSRREHCSWSQAQSPEGTGTDIDDVSCWFGEPLPTDLVNVSPSSQCSLRSDASDGGTRHLALVFFDVLLHDSRPLTGLPYHERRRILESIVLPIPGLSMLAERSPINLTKGADAASAQLRSIFVQALSDHQEGLVLKADEGAYIKSPWVKVPIQYHLNVFAR